MILFKFTAVYFCNISLKLVAQNGKINGLTNKTEAKEITLLGKCVK